jgi:hypothetical protein
MTGLQMLLKSFGINVDPEEATRTFESLKVEIPKFIGTLAVMLQSMNGQLHRIEESLKLLKFIGTMAAKVDDMDSRLKNVEKMLEGVLSGRRTERDLQREFDRINSGNSSGSNGAD